MIVYLDTELPNTYDKIIVVGGYLVNEVAKMLADAYPELYEIDTAGEYIVKKFDYEGKEYIVVFGYTAEDTGKAAQEFIAFLRENVA
ncbi:MAG: S-layer protein [Candidatus Diapherotrites archaeon]|nr:S-layer protein [Candidatus Diapherotrites archaeon]